VEGKPLGSTTEGTTLLGRVQDTALPSSEANGPAITSQKTSLTSVYGYCGLSNSGSVRSLRAGLLATRIYGHAAMLDGRAVLAGCLLRAQQFVTVSARRASTAHGAPRSMGGRR
jgi:hypothetical protein